MDSVIVIFLKPDEKTLQNSKVSTVNTKEIISRNDIVIARLLPARLEILPKQSSFNIYSGSFLPVFNPKEDTRGALTCLINGFPVPFWTAPGCRLRAMTIYLT